MSSISLRHVLAVLLLACCAAGPVAAAQADAGQPAPDLRLPGLQGEVRLAELKGKVVYLDFWASWCGPCRQSFPWMNEMQARYGARGFQVLAVNLDARREEADKFLAQVPARFTVAFDAKGDSARQYEVKGMPSSLLIGADGTILARHAGFRDEQRKELEAAIVAALAKAGK
ncbi:MAG: hypothetical protein RJA44_1975 [Pseudomonadota bacterium]